LISFWDQNEKVNPAVWITIIIVLIVCLNIFAVSIYGEAEFIFASIKIITILGLLICAFVIMLGGGPNHDRLGFRYWKEGAMKEYVGTGNTGLVFSPFFERVIGNGLRAVAFLRTLLSVQRSLFRNSHTEAN
jgi:amino acid permease